MPYHQATYGWLSLCLKGGAGLGHAVEREYDGTTYSLPFFTSDLYCLLKTVRNNARNQDMVQFVVARQLSDMASHPIADVGGEVEWGEAAACCAPLASVDDLCGRVAVVSVGGIPLCGKHATQIRYGGEKSRDMMARALAVESQQRLVRTEEWTEFLCWRMTRNTQATHSAEQANTNDPKIDYLYFMRSVRTGLIKIGVSVNPQKRAQSLRTNVGELEILTTIQASYDEERRLHRRFAEHRQHGEWFEPHTDLMGYIAAIKAKQAERKSKAA